MPESLEFSTRALPSAKRFSAFREFYSTGSDSVELGPRVAADVHAWRMDGLVAFERRLSDLGGDRLAERVRRNQFDHFTVQLNLGGEFHGEGANGFQKVGAGEILLLDMSRPSRTRIPDAHLITLSIAREAISAASAEIEQLHGLIIPRPLSDPLAAQLSGLPSRASGLVAENAEDEVVTIANFLRSALSLMNLGRPTGDQIGDPRLAVARRFIQEHIAEEGLNPARVARAADLSRATLYRVFDPIGGVGKYIQIQRLNKLRDRLSNPLERAPVAALAFDAGFASEQHASRSFKDRFGLPPAEFRARIRRTAELRYGVPNNASAGQMVSWYLNLGSETETLQSLRAAA